VIKTITSATSPTGTTQALVLDAAGKSLTVISLSYSPLEAPVVAGGVVLMASEMLAIPTALAEVRISPSLLSGTFCSDLITSAALGRSRWTAVSVKSRTDLFRSEKGPSHGSPLALKVIVIIFRFLGWITGM
jgi:hypothetical protein